MRIAKLLQTDYPEAVCTIAGTPKSVMTSGCGATCVAIVGQYLTGKTALGPAELFQWAYEQGYYFGDGLGHEALSAMALEFGLRSEWTKTDFGLIEASLVAGKPVIAHMGPGKFSSETGHYIVLHGITDQGLILVHDPYDPARSGDYEWKVLADEAKLSASFMLVR